MKSTRRSNAPKNIIGPRVLKDRLEKRNMSQEDLAGRMAARGITLDRSAISRIESQQRYLMDYEIVALAKSLGVSVAWLFSSR